MIRADGRSHALIRLEDAMKEAIVFVCIALCVSWGRTLIAQTTSSAPGTRHKSAPPPSSAPANASQTASSLSTSQNRGVTHWYADAANLGLLAVVSVLASIFYTFLTWIIVRYMKRQTLLQKTVNDTQIFEMIVRRLEATREARALIRDYVKKGEVVIPPPGPVLEAADRVCREFDFLGLIDRRGLVNHALVDEFYS